MTDWSDVPLLPPRRLGALLSAARTSRGLTLEEVADRAHGEFSLSALASIERGTTAVDDGEAARLAGAYGVGTASLVPARSHLVVDLEEGLLGVDERRVELHGDDGREGPIGPDELLGRYATLVYSMREATPGTPVTWRLDDLAVLGTVLHLDPDRVGADLDRLVAGTAPQLANRHRLLSRRVLIPAAGVLVATLGLGALLMVSGNDATTPAAAAAVTSVSSTVPTSIPAQVGPSTTVVAGVPVEVGAAVVQERNPDGSEGPVVVRHGEAAAPTSTTSTPSTSTTSTPSTSTTVARGRRRRSPLTGSD
ncbi:MAG: helix-turn-helix transcriptional regulator [Microthrixaceae bacterium]